MLLVLASAVATDRVRSDGVETEKDISASQSSDPILHLPFIWNLYPGSLQDREGFNRLLERDYRYLRIAVETQRLGSPEALDFKEHGLNTIVHNLVRLYPEMARQHGITRDFSARVYLPQYGIPLPNMVGGNEYLTFGSRFQRWASPVWLRRRRLEQFLLKGTQAYLDENPSAYHSPESFRSVMFPLLGMAGGYIPPRKVELEYYPGFRRVGYPPLRGPSSP